MVKLFTQKINEAGSRMMRLSMLTLVLLIGVSMLHAQTPAIKVAGTVTDSKGETLIGVTVKVKGTTTGVVTDVNGKYTVSVPDNKATLVFSYIGYNPHEEVVGDRKVINITLSETANDLSEVVITGYGGAVAKRDLTAAVSTVSAKQILERQPVTLFDALEGQAAGVLVSNDNGDPAGQGTIQIRGASSLNGGNGPLYVIDGVINDDANFLNPADIASIEILKDAASASIYGARGANGVILITTKRGQEGKPVIQVAYSHLFGQLAHQLQTTSSRDLRYFRSERGDGNAGTNTDSLNHYLNADNDYQDLLFRTANKDQLSISLSGGQKGLTYYTGLNFINDNSIVLNSYIKRIQAVINVDYQGSEKLKITNNLQFAYQTGNNIPVGTSAKQVFERNPWTAIYKPDGGLASYVESKRNPVAYALLYVNVPVINTAQYNTTVNYQFTKELKFTTSFNARLDLTNTNVFSPTSLTSGGTGIDNGSDNLDKKFNWELQSFLNYNKTFAKDHSVTALLGFSRDRVSDESALTAATNFLSEAVTTSNVGTLDITKTGTNATAHADESVFFRLGYNYKSRYIFSGTFRRDGSSRFGSDNKFGNFLSAGAAWRFSDESFMAWSKPFLEDAKLRYSIGQLGNDKVGDYTFSNVYNFGSDNGSASYAGNNTAALSTALGNPAIMWESTTTQNFGMDLSFLKGRVTLTTEYYIKNTSGLLYQKPLPEETGFVNTSINLGDIQNKGLEFTVTASPVMVKDFSWNVSANISFQSAGVIKSLANHIPFTVGNAYKIQEGGKIGDFWVLKNLGVYQYDVSNAYDNNWNMLTPVGVGNNGTTATGYLLNGQPYTSTVHHLYRNGLLKGGATIWQNTQKDSVIDDNDRIIAGNAVPKYYYGFTNFFQYKHWSLNVVFNGQVGNKVYNGVANGQNTYASTYSPPTVDAIYHIWKAEGDIATYPAIKDKDNFGSISNGYNSLYLEDGSFIRLASVRLNYTFSPKLISKIGAKSVSVYGYGDNLLMWTNYTWYDPEFSSSSALTQGTDNGTYPKRREVGFGVIFNF
jgi:TonB-linked SusC/RagA family outer membrane protein